jgi:two-component system, chemotaxis family, protein-glutamate methylesterase/glutaminase
MSSRRLRKEIDILLIGTSAGGVEALSIVLQGLRAQGRTTTFIVMHRFREQASFLPSIFSHVCKAPAYEAEDKSPAQPGGVYFAPPDYHLLIDPGPSIALSVDAPVHYSRPSIDVLFESAAQLFGRRVLGIILSGANEDGASGLQTVRRLGGMTAVQDPQQAPAAQMPAAALRAGPVDLTLSLMGLQELVAELP